MNHASRPRRETNTAATAMILAKAKAVLADSTATEAAGFNVEVWLDQWIKRPQPSLGGKCPEAFLGSDEGVGIICRLIGAMESGAYL